MSRDVTYLNAGLRALVKLHRHFGQILSGGQLFVNPADAAAAAELCDAFESGEVTIGGVAIGPSGAVVGTVTNVYDGAATVPPTTTGLPFAPDVQADPSPPVLADTAGIPGGEGPKSRTSSAPAGASMPVETASSDAGASSEPRGAAGETTSRSDPAVPSAPESEPCPVGAELERDRRAEEMGPKQKPKEKRA